MTWSYSPDQLNTNTPKSGVYQVRLLIGDTFSGDQQMQDEEIAFYLTTRATIYGAAAECCRTLATKFARSVDQAAGTVKITYSQMAKGYFTKVGEFEMLAAANGAGAPYAGGISIMDKQNQEANPDRARPQFNIGMMDNQSPESPVGMETEEDSSSTGLGPGGT